MDNFNTDVFNETQRNFIMYILESNAWGWQYQCEELAKNYFGALDLVEKLEKLKYAM